MEQLAMAVAKSIFVKQSVTIGSKVINNKRVTKTDEKGFWISLLILGLVVVVTATFTGRSNNERVIMSTKNNRTVFRNADGDWANKRNKASKAGSLHSTQGDAIKEASRMLKNSGGGELSVKGLDGKIRSKDTIAPGNDPNPPRDKEH